MFLSFDLEEVDFNSLRGISRSAHAGTLHLDFQLERNLFADRLEYKSF